MSNNNNLVSEVWSKSKLVFKVFIIGFIILLLLIPMESVKELVRERENRQKEAIMEVSSKWAGNQILYGPVLVVPYKQAVTDAFNKTVIVEKQAYFLPASVDINAAMDPIEKHRGIYKVMLYAADLSIRASFATPDIRPLGLREEDMQWNRAFIRMDVSDLKGLNEQVSAKWNDSLLQFSAKKVSNVRDALMARINLGSGNTGTALFNAQIKLNGSGDLMFHPSANATKVEVRSTYPHPSFIGSALPQESSIDSGFVATWRSHSQTLLQPRQFTDSDVSSGELLQSEKAFGVSLYVPVNAYQKTMRSVKYAVLCIVLTFAAFFLIEMANKRSVHPFQYGLIGLALVLFYSLLLSISEYLGFNAAYAIAAVATIALITWFVKGVLVSNRLSIILAAILALMYVYIFTILQLSDFALLLGSVGLFLTLAVIMHFSKKIQW